MGQGQSSDSAAATDAPAKADYYDLLGVERTASDDEIKKAYRRKALELHPDRNYGKVEDATRLFAEVQTAYEVLSDPQERAWYDSHRDVLLRGEAAGADGEEFSYNIRMTTAAEVAQMMLRFNTKMDYSNAPSGFYGGLSDFFKQLEKEESIACQWQNEDPMDYPEFGLKDDDYEDIVRPFYAAWIGFATRKSYAWKDQYRLSDAPDRRIRRLMEKENKKLRDEAIQEYNDAVRSLVAFVRKRDPRVQDNQKSEAERQKILRDATAAQAARSRAARQAQLQDTGMLAVPEWAQSRTKDDHEGDFSSESEKEEHQYECVVCDKTFKSEAQFTAHEKSKKHIKLLRQLKREMKDEDGDLKADPTVSPKIDEFENGEGAGGEAEVSSEDKDAERDQSLDDSETPHESERVTVDGLTQSKQGESESSSDADDDYASREDVEKRLASNDLANLSTKVSAVDLEETPTTSEADGPSKAKLGKAKQKRAKKAQQAASGASTVATSAFQCTVCRAEFPSKTKLFNHLREKNHAAPVTQAKDLRGGKGKKR